MKCQCGCGEDAPIADRTDRARGRVKGEPLRFVHGHNRRKFWEPPTEAWCKTCEKVKPADEFYPDPQRSSGLSSQCKDCRKADAKRWYAENTEQARASAKRWQAAHAERNLELKRRWRKANLEKHAEVQNRRRVRLAGAVAEKVDPLAIAERDNWHCHICGKRVAKKDMSLDHLVPVSKGGDHVALNLRLAHRKCNSARGPGRLPAQLLLL